MRAWKVTGKYPVYDDEAKVAHTDISIASTDGGYATFTERVTGDCRHKSDKELVDLALAAFFKSEFSDKAMAESVQKVEELERLSKDFRKEMAELKEVTLEEIRSEAQAEIAKLENSVKIAVLTINQLLLTMEDDDDESDDPEDSDN